MTPIVLAAQILKIFLEESPHPDDTVSHLLYFPEPLSIQSWVVEDLGCNAGTVYGRIRVQRPNENFDLGIHTLLLLCRFTHN